MPRFYWNKLVRDKIAHHSQVDPKVIHIAYRKLDDESFHRELVRKADEEAREIPIYNDGSDDTLNELADLQSVVDALRVLKGYSEDQVREAVVKKTASKGDFKLRHFVEYVDLAPDSEWVETFRAQPEKYHEEATEHDSAAA